MNLMTAKCALTMLTIFGALVTVRTRSAPRHQHRLTGLCPTASAVARHVCTLFYAPTRVIGHRVRNVRTSTYARWTTPQTTCRWHAWHQTTHTQAVAQPKGAGSCLLSFLCSPLICAFEWRSYLR